MAEKTNKLKQSGRDGFTLIEIIVAVAIVAILAGTITPLAFKELVRAREDATRNELETLHDALLTFYEDTGRFPTDGEGLAALINDPGVDGWQGPYVDSDSGDPLEEVGDDAFGKTYDYDFQPGVNPATAADVIIVSGGANQAITTGRVGQTWQLLNQDDDLLSFVSAGAVNRDKTRFCTDEMTVIGEAAGQYYEDHAAFPTNVAQLAGTYMNSGIDGSAFIDPWNRSYELTVTGGGTAAAELRITSWGPDRTDDSGGDDDLLLSVSSVPHGRKVTLWKLEIAQNTLNTNSDLALTGVWTNDRAALGLTAAFQADGWGQDFFINPAVRTVYSAGPDGNGAMATDNLPAGVGP